MLDCRRAEGRASTSRGGKGGGEKQEQRRGQEEVERAECQLGSFQACRGRSPEPEGFMGKGGWGKEGRGVGLKGVGQDGEDAPW